MFDLQLRVSRTNVSKQYTIHGINLPSVVPVIVSALLNEPPLYEISVVTATSYTVLLANDGTVHVL